MADRATVLQFADRRGIKAASTRYGIPPGTIRSWRFRAKRRAVRDAERPAPPPALTPAQDFTEQARRLAAWAAGGCIRCAGDGTVYIPAVTRGGLVIRRPRRIGCPECGGRVRRATVTEWPKREWAEGLRTAGDLGAGWSGEQWARIRAGESNPDGARITAGDRLEPGADG